MTDELFFNVMLAASSCMIVTGLILAAVKTPADAPTRSLSHRRRAGSRACL